MFEIKLTTGELLWLWRKRKRLSVNAAAGLCGVSHDKYKRAEADRDYRVPHQPRPTPTDAELLRVLRRRCPLPRDDLASRLGISHVQWLKLERAADPSLVAFWAANDGSSVTAQKPPTP